MALSGVVGGGIAAFIIGGSGLALADDDDDRRRARPGVSTGQAQTFELEIDPELDAQFPNRPVNGAFAARIVTDSLGGGQVTEVELEEDAGRPYWDVKVDFRDREFEVSVDAIDGQILGGDR
jgi:uncharacterized membrane protein YkoI